ncbi:MAG: bifunctional (p)ppGpp synthetase/guanosine-3',5'-bis(diphosphate) 3'-pyrophosphohydrolase [Proteobacteria bacterium]|nr:bifunctional (p)ppGpp synthetase/guanosine-3',5'-bis(diphosphate) 3'-pyrophosphohydrolase [Pseudomonadota bacterium]
MIRINDILERLIEVNPEADLDIVERAYIFSARVHDGQVRLSGEPYLSHPLEVAYILSDMMLDVESVAAGLLHDVIEDTHSTEDEIKSIFGPSVCHIVSGVTKLSKLTFHTAQAREAESIRKMILAMADDIRVILIKLADRIHNMRTLQYHKKQEKQIKIAQETFDIYVPLAARLGIYWIKNELENIAFKYILPDEFEKISSLVDKSREGREGFVEEVKQLLKNKMDSVGLKCEVLGRYKQYYSIYNKMVTQGLEYNELYDIIAFRIILNTIPQCYEALGHIHALWQPIAKKFKDYIGVPKPNMYQSLHTTVIGPKGERIEIQIRTHEMDQVAKSGIAAHWSYKEGKVIDEKVNKAYAWIQNLVENQKNVKDPDEFLENVRIDLFPDEVYVFSPLGEIKALPKGATPVDFAYMIHSEIGNECTGSRVNGRMVPLSYMLKTGDTVEIITTKGHTPSKDWLNFVKTVKARSKIRQWIKTQEKDRSVSLGREICEKAFRKYKLNFNQLMKSKEAEDIVASFGLKTADDLIANVGYGKITSLQIIKKFEPKTDQSKTSLFTKLISRPKKIKPSEGIVVKGLEDILVKFGKCCQPVPGDPITGYITQGRGVTVHRINCIHALKMNPDRQIDVNWNKEVGETFPVRILVHSYDRFGLLADITATISKCGANIVNANTKSMDNKTVDAKFTISVEDKEQLHKVISSIKKIKLVQSVKRVDRQ